MKQKYDRTKLIPIFSLHLTFWQMKVLISSGFIIKSAHSTFESLHKSCNIFGPCKLSRHEKTFCKRCFPKFCDIGTVAIDNRSFKSKTFSFKSGAET